MWSYGLDTCTRSLIGPITNEQAFCADPLCARYAELCNFTSNNLKCNTQRGVLPRALSAIDMSPHLTLETRVYSLSRFVRCSYGDLLQFAKQKRNQV